MAGGRLTAPKAYLPFVLPSVIPGHVERREPGIRNPEMNHIEIPNSALPARSGNDSSIGHGFELVLPIKPDQLALNLHPVRRQDADLIGGVGGFERYRRAATAETL